MAGYLFAPHKGKCFCPRRDKDSTVRCGPFGCKSHDHKVLWTVWNNLLNLLPRAESQGPILFWLLKPTAFTRGGEGAEGVLLLIPHPSKHARQHRQHRGTAGSAVDSWCVLRLGSMGYSPLCRSVCVAPAWPWQSFLCRWSWVGGSFQCAAARLNTTQ